MSAFVTECANPRCSRMFRDGPEVCGVCPTCGHENDDADDNLLSTVNAGVPDDYEDYTDYLNGMRG